MLKKIILFLVAIIMPGHLFAQITDSAKNSSDMQDVITSQEDVEVDSEEFEGVPVMVDPQEIIELETKCKKSIRRNLKNRDVTERENIIGVFTWQEKFMKIRELMRDGKSYREAKKIADDIIKVPLMNIKNDKEMEEYMYKKGNFTNNGK